MIPGLVSKLSESTRPSAATISVNTDIVIVTGTTQVNNITPNFGGGFGGLLVLGSSGGPVILGTTGNIFGGTTINNNSAKLLIYSKTTKKWYIVAGM